MVDDPELFPFGQAEAEQDGPEVEKRGRGHGLREQESTVHRPEADDGVGDEIEFD